MFPFFSRILHHSGENGHHEHHHNHEQPTIPRLTAREYARLPKALPCPDYYDIYPEEAGPTGTVVIKCREEMQLWALVAAPVTKEEALQQEGGCIEYVTGDPKNPVQYFHFHNSPDSVFGRASYLQRSVCGSVVNSPSG